MKILKSPIMVFSFICIILISISISPLNIAEASEKILWLAICLFLTLLIHELGHMIGGILTGSSLLQLTVGPFIVQRNHSWRLRMGFNNQWSHIGGITMLQIDSRNEKFSQKTIATFLGGPLASFIFSMFIFADGEFLYYLGVFNLFIFVVTIVPYNFSGLFSDGFVIIKFLTKDTSFITYHKMSKILVAPEQSVQWDCSLLEESASIDPNTLSASKLPLYMMFLFYGTVAVGDKRYLRKFIHRIKTNELEKMNKVYRINVMHFYLASQFILGEELTFDENDFKEGPTIDVVSKLRTMSILEQVKGKQINNTKTYIDYIKKNNTNRYAFWNAEKVFVKQYLSQHA
jgi:hypothetical protein